MKKFLLALALSIAPMAAHAANIAIDFGTGPNSSNDPDATAMSLTESAGVFAQTNWNSFTGNVQAVGQALVDDSGAATTATITWSSNNLWDTSASGGTDIAGNQRMMLGYLDTNDNTTTTVTVSNLPAAFLLTGYMVIVYYDGDNAAAGRVGAYTIGGTTLYGRDTTNTTFNGTFTQGQTTTAPTGNLDTNPTGVAQIPEGNYLQFDGLSSANFTLTAQSSVSSDASNRAPVNGIQIVQVPEPSAAMLLTAGVCGVLGLRRRQG